MTLPVPSLDTRRHADLVAEALRRVPRYAPEWTNHNDADPGKTLISVNAWLTETLLYQINQVPEQNHVAFLNLLGLRPKPAQAAVAELSFTLKPLANPIDPLRVDLPAGTRVAVDDPDLSEEVVFETTASAVALNAAIGLALVPASQGGWTPVTAFDSDAGQATWLHSFHPFDATETQGAQFVFALVLRPTLAQTYEAYSEDRMPSGLLDLYAEVSDVFDTDPAGTVIAGPLVRAAGLAGPAAPVDPALRWEVFTGEAGMMTLDGAEGWRALGVALDETAGLTRSGHVTLDLPAGVTPVPFGALPDAAWDSLRLTRPPVDLDSLIAAFAEVEDARGERLREALGEADWARMGVPAGAFNTVLSVCNTAAEVAAALPGIDAVTPIDPAAIPAASWAAILPDYAGPSVPLAETEAGDMTYRRLYFLRATLLRPQDGARMLNALRLNTVRAIAASTRKDERLGRSDGRPGQVFALSRRPVWFDPLTEAPDLVLDVVTDGLAETWTRVDDFFGQPPTATVYVLDPISGVITCGDGRPRGRGGAIPPPGAEIIARRYRHGGGAIGNVGAGSISKIKGSLPQVDSVTNLRASSGGADAETLEEVKGRAPGRLRMRDRAMSAQDFADLARETPGAAIHKAYAVAAHEPTGAGFAPRPGAVTVVVLPAREHPTPQALRDDLAAVQRWLDPRRLITTELFVTGPLYLAITGITAQLRLHRTADFQTVARAAQQAVTDWLHPLRGGPDGTGWPFGADIYHADLYDLLLAVPGVRRVARLSVAHPATGEDAPPDVIPLPEGHLPALAPGALDFEVVYDTA